MTKKEKAQAVKSSEADPRASEKDSQVCKQKFTPRSGGVTVIEPDKTETNDEVKKDVTD